MLETSRLISHADASGTLLITGRRCRAVEPERSKEETLARCEDVVVCASRFGKRHGAFVASVATLVFLFACVAHRAGDPFGSATAPAFEEGVESILEDYDEAGKESSLENWIVVHGSDVNVRKERSLQSNVIGTKRNGSYVQGKQEGEWVKLANEDGYMKIDLSPSHALLKRFRHFVLHNERKRKLERPAHRPIVAIGDHSIIDVPMKVHLLSTRPPILEPSAFPTKPVPDTPCAGDGENCLDSMCCKVSGYQCYAKDFSWAACKEACAPGPDPTDPDSSPWKCKALGNRTEGSAPPSPPMNRADWVVDKCSSIGDNCNETRCCKDWGYQCYEKTKSGQSFAMCKVDCSPGPDLRDVNSAHWTCVRYGSRTPGDPKPQPPAPVPSWVQDECSGEHEDCRETKCCKGSGEQCYRKHSKWAECRPTCQPGKRGWDNKSWSCETIGQRTGRASWSFPSLYCWSVIRTLGYEVNIMRKQITEKKGIFACDERGVYSTGKIDLGHDEFGPVAVNTFPNAPVGTSQDGTAANTQLFINAWNAVNQNGRAWNHDWTIKADPDAVLFPDRLRPRLAPHIGVNAFIKNCDKPGMTPMMFGSLEVLSFLAVQSFFTGFARCQALPWQAWGEDYFLSHCLEMLGSFGIGDFAMVSDGVCKGLSCSPGAAAYHPLKSDWQWEDCYNHALR